MKHFRTLFAAAVLAAALAAPAIAQEKLVIDNTHSVAGFSVRHLISKVPGRFGEVQGTILYDAKNLANSSVEVTIPAASIDTRNERRDNHLKSDDFFAVEKNPNITFKSTKVVPGKSADKFQVLGDLTMRGVTRPVTLEVTQLGWQQGAQTLAAWEATTTVNRKDYGIVWNRTLDQGGTMLGDEVAITLNIAAKTEAPKKDAAAPASTK